jgi:CelD/BcsL family acetyltransferase involved in cellulose biosynthesis
MMPQLVHSTNVVTDLAGFRALAPEWDALLGRSDQRSFFLGWRWNFLWWSHFAPPHSHPFIVCCRDTAGTLVGIAPLYLSRRDVLGIVQVRELHLLGTGIELRISEHVDIFAARGSEAAAADAMGEALMADARWDRLCLHAVPAESVLTSRLLRAAGLEGQVTATDLAPYIDTSQGWEHYKRTLGRSMRRNVEYYARRLVRQHDCAFDRVESPDDVDGAVDDLVRLHQARWQAVGEPGSLGLPDVTAFMRASAHAAHAAGQLRLWRLRIDGRVEAALIGFVDNGVLHYFQKGFNPAYAPADIGTAMLGLCVKDCCEDERIQAFDFMGGGAAYKWMWARQHRELARHEASRTNARTLTQRVWVASRDATARLYRAAAPSRLREARRRWHKRRRLREIDKTLTRVTAATTSTGASPSSPTGPPN